MTRSRLFCAALLSGSVALGIPAFAQTDAAPATAPSTGETGQPGTMGSSQPETTDKAPVAGTSTNPADAPSAASPAATSASPAAAAVVLVPIDKTEAPVPQLNLMVGQVDEMDVIGADGNEIGGVGAVLGDQAGNAKALSVDVGGFLGIGEKTVILNLSDVTLDTGRLRTTLTKQQIETLPDFSG